MNLNVTTREKQMLAYGAAVAYGFASKRKTWYRDLARWGGLGLLLGELASYAKEQGLFHAPETMNAHFRTGGALSATGGNEIAAEVIRTRKLVT